MFNSQQSTPAGPKFADSLGGTRPSKLAKERSDATGPGGAKMALHRQVDLRAILKTSRLEESLFDISYLATHENDLSPRLSWLFLLLEDVQWLAFAFSGYLIKDLPPWFNLLFDPIRAISDYDTFVIVNVATILLVFTVATIIGAITVVMQRRGKVPLIALRVLRLLCALIMTALSIPIATFLIMGVHCVDGKMPKWGTLCFAAPHLPLYIFNLLGLVIFVPLLVLGVTLFIETDPASKSPISKAHSRTDLIDVLVRLVLVLGDVMLYKSSDAFHWAFMAISTMLLMYLSWHMSRTQPYYNLTTTAFRSGMCMATACAMICAMCLRGLIGFDSKGYWFALVPSAVVGFVAGAGFAHGHNRQFLRRTVRTWHRIMREEDTYKSAASSSDASLQLPPQNTGPASPQPAIGQGSATVTSALIGYDAKVNMSGSLKRTRTTSAAAVLRSAPMSPAGSRAPPRSSGTSPLKIAIAADTSTDSLPGQPPHIQAPTVSTKIHESTLESPAPSPSNQTRTSPILARPNRAFGPNVASMRDTLAESSSGSLLPAPPATTLQRRSPSSNKLQLMIPTAEQSDRVISSVLRGTSTEALNAVRERAPRKRLNVFDSPLEVEVCIRFIRESPTDKQITIGLHLLERGLTEYPSDPMLLLLAATYLSTYYGQDGERIAEGLMKELESSRHVPLDVKFLGYCRERSLRNAGAHVLDKVALDSLDRESRSHHLRAMYALRDVWECVRTKASAERLAEVTAKLAFHRTRASTCYARLLARNSRDKNSLRLFAQYTSTVEQDQLRAQQIIDLADDVEAREARESDDRFPSRDENLDSFDDMSIPSLPDSPPPEPAVEPLKGVSEKQSGIATTSLALFAGTNEYLSHDPTANPAMITGTINRATFHSNVPTAPSQGNRKNDSNNALSLRKAASQHGSQTSGTSVSRAQRQRASLRRIMEARLTRPLQGAWHTGALILLFLAALIIGFVLCLNFMALSNESIGTDFTQTRIGRRAVIRMVEGIRHMAYGSAVNSNVEYQTGVATVRFNYNAMVATVLPILNRLEAANSANTPHFRLYNRIVVNNTRVDYVPLLVSPTELANIVLQAGALALGYTTNGTLTAAVANTLPEFSFLFENLFGILAASKELPVTGIRAYNQIGAQISMYLIVTMTISLLALSAVALVVYFRVTLAYFSHESLVHGLLLSVHTKIASGLVTNMEEEIESFREITQEDEAHELDHSLMDVTNGGIVGGSADVISGNVGVGSSVGSSFSVKGRGASAVAKATGRQRKFVVPFLACVVGIGAIVVALFTVTLSSLQVEVDMQRLLDVSDRRYYANALRVAGREAVAGPAPGFVQTEPLIQNLRTYLLEADEIHQRLINDPTGLSVQVPELTALPRNCTLPTSCNFVPENREIGFTRILASLPFNIEITRLLDTGRYFVDQLLDANARQTIRTSEAFTYWQLMEAISLDVEDRSRELEIGAQARLMGRLANARSWIMVTFVLLIIASLAAFAFFVLLGVNPLKREAAVLVLLLHMIPPGMLKDLPELSGFLETGGLALMT